MLASPPWNFLQLSVCPNGGCHAQNFCKGNYTLTPCKYKRVFPGLFLKVDDKPFMHKESETWLLS